MNVYVPPVLHLVSSNLEVRSEDQKSSTLQPPSMPRNPKSPKLSAYSGWGRWKFPGNKHLSYQTTLLEGRIHGRPSSSDERALVLKYQKSYDYALGDRDSEKSLGRSRIAFSMQGKVQT